ncbi:integrase catalytic domain-containing protein [Trichonephila clavipes]|nr:integrase catalytic domain-containing protein [Trichonephila clavipes]
MPSVVNSDFEVKNQGSSQGLVSTRSAEVKLPTLSLPIFSGVTEEWLAFSDLFEAAVSNNDLTGAQKLQYLKGSLKSDALKIVNSLSITNDNFEIAWNLLKDRYFNKREIMSSLIKKFINITLLSGESSTQILNLIDSTKEFVRMLESLEYQVDPTSDTLLMHMILFKLDPNSRTWFERTFSTDVISRCLLDSGSQASLITNECIERLGLRKEKANVRISCLGASDTRINGVAEIQFTSHFSSQNSFHASVYVINKIVGMIPHLDLDSSMRELFGDISLADPAFYKSGPIDTLLGVDLTLHC